MDTEANPEAAAVEVSRLRDLYDVVTLTIHFRGEGGALVARPVRFAHKHIDREMWARLEAIEAEESDTPADVRQLVALDLFSPDLADGCRPAELSAEVLLTFGAVLRSRLVGAIVPNALNAAAASGVGREKPAEGPPPVPAPRKRGAGKARASKARRATRAADAGAE